MTTREHRWCLQIRRKETPLELLKSRLHWREVDFEEAVSHNTPAFQSVARPKKREAFYDRLGTMPFDRLVKRAILPPIYKRNILEKLRHVVGLILRKGKMIKVSPDRFRTFFDEGAYEISKIPKNSKKCQCVGKEEKRQ